MDKKLGSHYFGVRLMADAADGAIYDGVLVQMTINTRGRVVCVLDNGTDITMQYDSNLIFESRDDAAAFWEKHNGEFKAIEKEFADAAKTADEKKDKIIGDAQFAHLAAK